MGVKRTVTLRHSGDHHCDSQSQCPLHRQSGPGVHKRELASEIPGGLVETDVWFSCPIVRILSRFHVLLMLLVPEPLFENCCSRLLAKSKHTVGIRMALLLQGSAYRLPQYLLSSAFRLLGAVWLRFMGERDCIPLLFHTSQSPAINIFSYLKSSLPFTRHTHTHYCVQIWKTLSFLSLKLRLVRVKVGERAMGQKKHPPLCICSTECSYEFLFQTKFPRDQGLPHWRDSCISITIKAQYAN